MRDETDDDRWLAIDRSDWPEILVPDFGGVMVAICPGCGLYRHDDDSPEEHLDDRGPCPWMTAHIDDREGET